MILTPPAENDTLKPSGFRINLSGLVVSTIAINVLSLALPILTLQIYDRILPNPGLGTAHVLIIGVCTALFLEMVLRLCRSYMIGWAGACYEHRISCGTMNHIINADLTQQAGYGTGEFLHRVGAVAKLKDFYNGTSQMTLIEAAFIPVFLGLIVYIAGPLAFIPASILMLFTTLSLYQGQKLRVALKNRDLTDDKRYDFLIESLEGIHTLKALALENVFSRRYEALEDSSTRSNYTVTQTMSNAFDISAVFSNVMVAAVICTGAYFAVIGQITTGTLIATILLSGRLMQPVNRVLSLWIRYQDYRLAREKVEEIFDTPQTYIFDDSAPFNPPREGKIDIRGLSFRRAENQPWIIRETTLSLTLGDCILLNSDNTAENAALFDMIGGLYAPTAGEIMVDGHNVMAYPPEKLVSHVGVIHSEGTIFRGSIRDNITCFGRVDEKLTQEIAALLHVDQDVGKLASGFDTYLNGNNTDTISPGLKQRISMVRVLAQKPRLILFDNADRALDREGYNLIHSLIAQLKGKATMILISDDQNLQSIADAHYGFDGGKLLQYTIPSSPQKIQNFRELKI